MTEENEIMTNLSDDEEQETLSEKSTASNEAEGNNGAIIAGAVVAAALAGLAAHGINPYSYIDVIINHYTNTI